MDCASAAGTPTIPAFSLAAALICDRKTGENEGPPFLDKLTSFPQTQHQKNPDRHMVAQLNANIGTRVTEFCTRMSEDETLMMLGCANKNATLNKHPMPSELLSPSADHIEQLLMNCIGEL